MRPLPATPTLASRLTALGENRAHAALHHQPAVLARAQGFVENHLADVLGHRVALLLGDEIGRHRVEMVRGAVALVFECHVRAAFEHLPHLVGPVEIRRAEVGVDVDMRGEAHALDAAGFQLV